MSKKRHRFPDPERALFVRTYAVTHPASVSVPTQTHDWHQLAMASRGVMSVNTTQGTWVVPPHRAVWIPAGVQHRIDMFGSVAVRSLYFATSAVKGLPTRCLAVNVSPLLRELVLHAVRVGPLRRDIPTHARLARVILDQLQTLPALGLQLPFPRDPRARRAADLMLRDPERRQTLDAVAHDAGASKRSLERLFRRDTHMTLGRWRQRARLIESLRLLAAGHAITTIALEVGYRSPSAFVAAFRRELGTTPGAYFGS